MSRGSRELLRDGAVVDRGHVANVLDGPLSALRFVRASQWLTPCSHHLTLAAVRS
jgi:hypothetical protein